MQSLRTGLKILNEFSNVEGELTVTDLATRLKMQKSQVSRMLAAFREEGWVTQNPATRAFSIGIAAYSAGARFINSNRLTREALPVLREVVDRCGFTCTLSVLDSTRPLYLLGIDGPISADFASKVGTYFHHHATASGKLLTAFADDQTRSVLLKRERIQLTPQTVVDLASLRTELARIQKQGFAVSFAERIAGIGAIAVPVFGAKEECLAALGIAYPISLVAEAKFEYFAELLHGRARTLSMRMGAQKYPFGGDPQPVHLSTQGDMTNTDTSKA